MIDKPALRRLPRSQTPAQPETGLPAILKRNVVFANDPSLRRCNFLSISASHDKTSSFTFSTRRPLVISRRYKERRYSFALPKVRPTSFWCSRLISMVVPCSSRGALFCLCGRFKWCAAIFCTSTVMVCRTDDPNFFVSTVHKSPNQLAPVLSPSPYRDLPDVSLGGRPT